MLPLVHFAWLTVACAHTVKLSVQANWTNPPFALQLLEAAAGHDESLYCEVARNLYSEDTSDFEDNEESDHTDESSYRRATRDLSNTQIAFTNLNLANKIYGPRIEAHYAHYRNTVSGTLEAKVAKKCAKDSFGQELDDPLGSWVSLGSEIYCSVEDLFAVQTDRSVDVVPQPFDRVFGSEDDAPVAVLYGNTECERFASMFSTLLSFSDSGHFRFIWRYVPLAIAPNIMSGYGASLTVKQKEKKAIRPEKYANAAELMAKAESGPVYEFSEEDLPRIAATIASLSLQEKGSEKQLEVLKQLMNNIPLYAPYLARAKDPFSFRTIKDNAAKNENKGASSDLIGISVNGAAIHKLDTDYPQLLATLNREVDIIQKLKVLGFSTSQAKLILTKFALMSAFHENEFRTGLASNRYTVYKDEFRADDPECGGVVFFNNLERDENYNLYSTDRNEVYVANAGKVRRGQLPPLKENVHDLIFVLNFSNKNQLKVFFAMSKMILDKGIPQQLGILPLVQSEKDQQMADMFYHILQVGEYQEALAFLYKYYEDKEDEADLFGRITMSEEAYAKLPDYKKTIEKFSFDEPSVAINGVIHSLRSQWQSQMGIQISHDVQRLQKVIQQGIHDDYSLKDVLFEDAREEKNSRVVPKDPSNIRYKLISEEMIENSVAFKLESMSGRLPGTFWLIGDFTSQTILSQFKILLNFLKSQAGTSLQIRVFNTSSDNKLLSSLIEMFDDSPLSDEKIDELLNAIGDFNVQMISDVDEEKLAILERNQILPRRPALIFNSRYFRLDKLFGTRDLELLLEYEYSQRLEIFKEITDAYPDEFSWKLTLYFRRGMYDESDWFDLLSSLVTYSFYLEDSIVRTDVARFDFSSLSIDNSIRLNGYSTEKLLDVLVVVDPIDDCSRKSIAMASTLADLPFANVLILLQPFSKAQGPNDLKSFYSSGYISLAPRFTTAGAYVETPPVEFSTIPSANYVAAVETPPNWHVLKGANSDKYDLDNLLVTANTEASFVLDKLTVEAFAKDVRTAEPIPGLTLVATQFDAQSEAISMQTMGYSQFQLAPGVWELSLKEGSASEEYYSLLSASDNKYIANVNPQTSVPVTVFSLSKQYVHPRISTKVNAGDKDAYSIVQSKETEANQYINVFSIASGHTYESLLAMMMVSVKKHAGEVVKFWLFEDYLSANIIEQLPKLAKKYEFEFELVSYNWPVWLRQQKEHHRSVWGYKILFLDVLFPADLERVIFVDADQIARTDLSELMAMDLEGAPYGFAPMCETRDEMEGFRFWKTGYWKTVLKDDLRYHISALFVVDLKTFRENGVGDKLRSHYQKLSSDPNSLANLDQDLPNNLQRQIPIYTLPQEWLWCETWCSEELKKHAKMIDLCDNPVSLEGKLDRARRVIPEWEGYNKELQDMEGDLGVFHDEL